jgi:hypothetical protein
MKGAKSFRSSLIDTVRKNALAIFSIDSVTELRWYSAHYDRSKIPAIVDLLKDPGRPNEEYPMYPRVLFTDYKVVEEEAFGSPAILKVSQIYPVGFNSHL